MLIHSKCGFPRFDSLPQTLRLSNKPKESAAAAEREMVTKRHHWLDQQDGQNREMRKKIFFEYIWRI